MFCDGCGGAVQPGQAYCSRCGKQIVGTVIAMPTPTGRVHAHVHLLGLLWLALSAFNVVGGLILLVLGTTFFPHLRNMTNLPQDVPVGFFSALFCTLGALVLTKAACGFFAGWGLLKRHDWARVLALVLSFISLFNIPFGTALGVYTMWVLLPSDSQREYDTLAIARAA
jgi:hypothetical protein